LDDENLVFQKYKNMHIAEVLEQGNDDFLNFLKTNNVSKVHRGDIENCDVDKLSEIVNEIPEYTELVNQYNANI